MPRMNLTETEVELIRRRREVEQIQRETYNGALSDFAAHIGVKTIGFEGAQEILKKLWKDEPQ